MGKKQEEIKIQIASYKNSHRDVKCSIGIIASNIVVTCIYHVYNIVIIVTILYVIVSAW